MIIAAFAGTGKTTLASMYPDNAVDFVCMPYKYHLTQNGSEGEASKANPANVLREDWPRNYVSAIKLAAQNGKTLLIPSDGHAMRLLWQDGIPYTLCYPRREARDIYGQRFIGRGNTEEFLSVFIGGWDWFMDALESTPAKKRIVLEPHQFLGDVVYLKGNNLSIRVKG